MKVSVIMEYRSLITTGRFSRDDEIIFCQCACRLHFIFLIHNLSSYDPLTEIQAMTVIYINLDLYTFKHLPTIQ